MCACVSVGWVWVPTRVHVCAGAVGQPDSHKGMQGATCCPPWRRTPAAVSMPAEKERARNWEERKQQSNWAQSRPTHGSEMSPTGHTTRHKGTMRCEHYSNHQMGRTPSEPSATPPPPPFPLQGAHILHKGGSCAPHAGRCPPRGWQQGRDQPTAHGTVHVVRICEILARGGRRVGQEGVTGAPTSTNRQEEEQHRHTERGSHTRRDKGERQPEQREQGTRMERMGERAHGRQRQ